MRRSTEQRRLMAVLVADIFGYSRLMAENEADTFYRLKDLQTTLIAPTADRNHGHVVKWTGDGFIAIFDSAVDAVRAAVEIQSGVAAAGATGAEDRRIRLRIGINAGDVILVPDDVYGDTVNIAARLETLAPPGGICISRGVRDTVRGKFSVEFEDLGDLAVKNIPDPIGTFSVVFDPIAWTMARNATAVSARHGGLSRRWARAAISAAIVATIGLAAAGAWYLRGSPGDRQTLAGAAPRAGAPSAKQPMSSVGERILARLASAVPGLADKAREERARAYEESRAHKAQAASPDPPGTWRSGARPAADEAETAALEECQVFFGQPCILIAVDDALQPIPKDGIWPRRDMPRARYDGLFDPAQIPGSGGGMRQRPDIAGYRSAQVPKAAAYHPSGGRMFTINGTSTQRDAEEQVLKTCNADPARNGVDGSCFLYAVGDQVVLSRRLKQPLTAAETR